jgi:nucleoside-diphosphate-sugar epimerase
MNVLIAGCGDVGNALATLLLQNGHVVYGLKRNTLTLPKEVIAIQADLTNTDTLTGLPQNIDSLVFMPTPGKRDQAAYESIFHDGWRNLWSSLKRPPARTILVSSTAVYGQSDGSIVNEETIPEPARFNGEALLQMEQLAADCTDNLVVARVSGIYGPGREGMIRLAASTGLEIQKSPPVFTNRVHRDDVAAALMHLMFLNDPQALYLLTDDLPVAKYDVLAWIAAFLGNEAPNSLVTGQGSEGKRVSNKRLRGSGFQLNFPDYRAGYGAILEHNQKNQHTR